MDCTRTEIAMLGPEQLNNLNKLNGRWYDILHVCYALHTPKSMITKQFMF